MILQASIYTVICGVMMNYYLIMHKEIYLDVGIEKPAFTAKGTYIDERSYNIIHHSHMDPGWVNTRSNRQKDFDTFINTMIDYYSRNNTQTKHTFTFADIVFLEWYIPKYEENFKAFKKLVTDDIIEVVNCGMSMPDQAQTSYEDIINSYEFGREFCLEHFNKLPIIGWSIDPFGESSYMSRVLSEMGYEIQVINRIDYKLKSQYKSEHKMIFNWKGIREEDDLLTFLAHSHYSTPDSIFWPDNNLISLNLEMERQSEVFMMILQVIVSSYDEKEVLIFIGDDFRFVDWDFELSKYRDTYRMIHSNNKSIFKGVQIKVTKFEEYLDIIMKKEKKEVAEVGPRDFFPLIDKPSKFMVWTGYFVSRPDLKLKVKLFGKYYRGFNHIVAQKILAGVIPIGGLDIYHLVDLVQKTKYGFGISTHHDSITGTATQQVVHEYLEVLDEINSYTMESFRPLLEKIVGIDVEYNYTDWMDLNFKTTKSIKIGVSSQQVPGIKVVSLRYDRELEGRVLLYRYNDDSTESRVGQEDTLEVCEEKYVCEIMYYVHLDRFESIVVVARLDESEPPIDTSSTYSPYTSDIHHENSEYRIEVSYMEKKIHVVEHSKTGGGTTRFFIEVGKHIDPWLFNTNNVSAYTGLYSMNIFSKGVEPFHFSMIDYKIHGDIVVFRARIAFFPYETFHFIYNPRMASKRFQTRFFFDELIDTETVEYVARYKFEDVELDGYYYTDSNGMDMMKRKYDEEMPISSNVYPLTKFVQVNQKDQKCKYSIITDRATGGVLYDNSIIEVGLTRVNKGFDEGGVPESNDISRVIIEHTILKDCTEDRMIHRVIQIEDEGDILIGKCNGVNENYSRVRKMEGEEEKDGERMDSETRRYLKSLMDYRKTGMMVRLYNMHEDREMHIPDVSVLVSSIYGRHAGVRIPLEERSLDFNQRVDDAKKQAGRWNPKTRQVEGERHQTDELTDGRGVVIPPLKYRTFKIDYASL
jgi:hypothetical protein